MFENRDTCRKIYQEKSLLSIFDMIAQEEEMMLRERELEGRLICKTMLQSSYQVGGFR